MQTEPGHVLLQAQQLVDQHFAAQPKVAATFCTHTPQRQVNLQGLRSFSCGYSLPHSELQQERLQEDNLVAITQASFPCLGGLLRQQADPVQASVIGSRFLQLLQSEPCILQTLSQHIWLERSGIMSCFALLMLAWWCAKLSTAVGVMLQLLQSVMTSILLMPVILRLCILLCWVAAVLQVLCKSSLLCSLQLTSLMCCCTSCCAQVHSTSTAPQSTPSRSKASAPVSSGAVIMRMLVQNRLMLERGMMWLQH